MGYCYITGARVNGRWKFTPCDGRKSTCPNGMPNEAPPMPGLDGTPRNAECVEYARNHREAVEALENWLGMHTEDCDEEE